MASNNPFTQQEDVYQEAFTQLYTPDEAFEELNLSMSDGDLDKMLISSLEADREHWNKKPWNLEETDLKNTAFLLGDQLNDKDFLKTDTKIVDNRLFSSTRAILSYATGQLAKPDIIPSRGDDIYLKGARDIGSAMYQHAADEKVDFKVRAATMNLISRKRGFLKLRFDPNAGMNGDVVTEVCNPEDIIVDRFAGYLENPKKIYHRIRCTIDELCARFPDKQDEIYTAFSIVRGVYSQTSRMVTYFECWFSYTGEDGSPQEGVCWFIHEKRLILDKMQNPNWVYMKNHKKEMEANVMSMPPKPFVVFNYINTGHSYIDETCLIEQAIPLQTALNKRLRQISENADYVNGRWVASKKSFSQEDARNLINKGAKTVAMVDREDVSNSLMNVAPNQLGAWVENTVYDYRNEIDGMMGTPSQFKGSQPTASDTLGRDLMIKQQAGALQDDLVRSISMAMEQYYTILLQMMRVYYTDDYWFQTRGGDGQYQFIVLNGDKIDSNVKVSVQVDSTLPLDKASVRATSMDLWKSGRAIDYKTLMEDLGLPNPDVRAERYLKSSIDPINFLKSVEMGQVNDEVEADVDLLIANKTPEERDNYDENYFNYFNQFMASNRFQKLQGTDPQAAQRITMFLIAIQHTMMESLNKQESIQPPQTMDAAGIVNDPMPMPIPKTTIHIAGAVDPNQSAQLAGVQPDQSMQLPNPNAQVPANAAPMPASPPVPTQ
jgi:hypothetical protein